jgi:hypothetical protein
MNRFLEELAVHNRSPLVSGVQSESTFSKKAEVRAVLHKLKSQILPSLKPRDILKAFRPPAR